MLRVLCAALSGTVWLSAADAKPLLNSSEDTYVRVCIDHEESYTRLVAICEQGLTDPGASRSQRLEMMDSLGHALMALEQAGRARDVFQEMLTMDANSADALTGLGWLEYNEDRFEDAVAFFRQSVERGPTAGALAGLGSSLHRGDEIDLDAALEYLDGALSLSPEYLWVMREKGWLLRRADKYEAAEAVFREVLDIYDEDGNALLGLARTLRSQDKYEAALPIITKATRLYPDEAAYANERARLLYLADRNKSAVKEAQRMIDGWPDDSRGYVRKARPLADLGRREEALDLLSEAYDRLDHDNFLAYWYARLLIDDAQHGAGIAVLKDTIRRDEADRYDFELMARAQLARDYVDGAREPVKQALALDPEARIAIFYDALIMIEDGKYDAAQARFDEALALGLPWYRFREFNTYLIRHGRFMQAIALRVRYNDRNNSD